MKNKIKYGIIYKVTCLETNKIYIGKTTKLLKDREYRHYNDAESNRLDTHFARAIRKYGRNNFIFEEIDEAFSEKELDAKEKKWIKYFDSAVKGYNETDGGEGGNTYKHKSEEEMNIIKNKIRETKIGKNNPCSVSIKAKNVETGQELFFDSMMDCQKYFNEPHHAFCSERCREKMIYMYKGKWMFAYQDKEYNPNYSKIKPVTKRKGIKVINLNTKEEKIFISYTEAEQYCGRTSRNISKLMISHNGYYKDKNYEYISID